MKTVMTLVFYFSIHASFAQTTTNYYKDENKWKDATEKNAKYKEVILSKDDGVVKKEFYRLKDNQRLYVKYFKNGKPYGIWRVFDNEGEIVSERNFDELVYGSKEPIPDYHFQINKKEGLDFEPAHYKTEDDMYMFLSKTIRYPNEAKDAGIDGMVYVRFKINKDGTITDAKIIEGVDAYLDYEALRILTSFPNWTPAKKDGVIVESYCTFPIKFTLR